MAAPGVDRERRTRLRRIVLWMAGITAAHFTLGTRTHVLHGWHILLASAYMLPIVDAALGFGLRGGLLAAGASMLAYATHLGLSWSGEPLANLDQVAMLGVYLFVGASSGLLAREAERRRRERDEVVRRSLRSETLRGLLGLVAALGARSTEAHRHAERVSRLCDSLACELHLDRDQRFEVSLAGLVHDVGRLAARNEGRAAGPAGVDHGPDDEGARRSTLALLRTIPGAEPIVAIVGSLQQSTRGSGEPAGPGSGWVHPGARIVQVADVYIGLIEGRGPTGPVSPAGALDAMHRLAGVTLDEDCLRALEALVARGHAPTQADDR